MIGLRVYVAYILGLRYRSIEMIGVAFFCMIIIDQTVIITTVIIITSKFIKKMKDEIKGMLR